MKQKNEAKINFFIYTIILGLIWGFIYILIDQLMTEATVLGDFLKAFVFVIISGALTYVMFYYFRGFYNKGKLK